MCLFKGSGVALITPFDSSFEIDYDSLESLIDFHLKNKTDALIICATTGEASTLNDKERFRLIDFCVKKVNHKVPIIAGAGSNDTKHSIILAKTAELLGVDGLLVVTPYYNKATQKGMELHYKKIAESVNIPILLYNVPSRTGCNLLPETVINIIKENNNIVGIKEASKDIKQIEKLMLLANINNMNIDLYSGNDDDILDVIDCGGKGVISVCANIIPNEVHDMIQKYVDGDIKAARIMEKDINELNKVLFSEVNPIPIKNACYNMRMIKNDGLRLPLTRITEENEIELIKVLKKQSLKKA